MERNIPHIRDIFSLPSVGGGGGRNGYPTKQPYYIDDALRDFHISTAHHYNNHHKSNHNGRHHHDHHSSQYQPTSSDSAVSLGDSSNDEEDNRKHQRRKKKSDKEKAKREEDMKIHMQSRTLRARDVQHLERHLSMKKTIRKKMMRDLRQALYVDDDEERQRQEALRSDRNVLDQLRADEGCGRRRDDCGRASPARDAVDEGHSKGKNSFWKRLTAKKSGKR